MSDTDDSRPLEGANVLLVEDEPLIAMMLEIDLRKLGSAKVLECSTIEAALEALRKGPVHLAVLDVHIRTANSFEIATELVRRKIPFVFASGSFGDEVPAAFQHIEFISKPFGHGALRDALLRARGSALPRPRDNGKDVS